MADRKPTRGKSPVPTNAKLGNPRGASRGASPSPNLKSKLPNKMKKEDKTLQV